MTTLIHADIFFFISTICFVLLTIVGVVALVHVISILRQVKKITTVIGNDMQHISTDAKIFLKDVRDSGVYRLLFTKKRKR